MKGEFIEFLFKRIGSKLDDVGETTEDFRSVEDLESYIDKLKEIVIELL